MRRRQHLRSAHCSGNLRPLPASLPESVIDLTTRCLALQPGDRYQSWEEVETAIAAAYRSTIKHPVPAAEPADAPTESERALEGWYLNVMGCVCERGRGRGYCPEMPGAGTEGGTRRG